MTHVVLTRAEPDAKRQLDLLIKSGFEATALPLLAIEPVAVTPATEADGEDGAVVIFTSANAVTHGFTHVMDACRRESTEVLAVGRKTRELLSARGIEASSPAREDSEGLLAFLASRKRNEFLPPMGVTLIKGEGGRDLLTSVLTEQGFSVVEVNCYRRVWPPVSRDAFLHALESHVPRYIHVASGETLLRLDELCGLYGVSAHEHHTVILPSDRVEAQARELGWQSRIVAMGASDDALLEILSTLP